MQYIAKNKTFGVLIKMASAKDPFWGVVDNYKWQRKLLFSIMRIQKEGREGIQIVIGPLNMIFGWTHNQPLHRAPET